MYRDTARAVQQQLSNQPHQPRVAIRREWYYW